MNSQGSYTDEEAGDLIVDINVTPMVDIMLVLLIIFMVTATYIVNPSIPVKLPSASRADTEEQPSRVLTLQADGSLALDDAALTERALFYRLRDAAGKKGGIRVVLSGDRAVPHGRVMRVIDILRRAGVARFAINVQVEEGALDDLH